MSLTSEENASIQDVRQSGLALELGSHLILAGECLQIMSGMEAGSVAAIITDPPYGTTSNKWDVPFNIAAWWANEQLDKKDSAFLGVARNRASPTFVRGGFDGRGVADVPYEFR